jgi:electron transfer flavoprotein beta subunit
LKLLVFVKEVPDVRIPVLWEESTGKLRKDRQVWQLNPPDRSALALALAMKGKESETQITAIHFGPSSGERVLRECLALGCDRGLRIWNEGLEEIQPHVKAFIFFRAIQILGYDLLFTGASSLDSGNGQVGLLLAAYLDIPCIVSALNLEIAAGNRSLIATQRLDYGYRARISSSLPAVVTVETLPECCPEPPLVSRLDACEREIPCLHLSELGIPGHGIRQMNSLLDLGPLQFPKPRIKHIPAPDPALPAFLRIAQLVQGTVKRRAGRLIRGPEAQVAEELFQTLLHEGCLDHLRKKAGPKPL